MLTQLPPTSCDRFDPRFGCGTTAMKAMFVWGAHRLMAYISACARPDGVNARDCWAALTAQIRQAIVTSSVEGVSRRHPSATGEWVTA